MKESTTTSQSIFTILFILKIQLCLVNISVSPYVNAFHLSRHTTLQRHSHNRHHHPHEQQFTGSLRTRLFLSENDTCPFLEEPQSSSLDCKNGFAWENIYFIFVFSSISCWLLFWLSFKIEFISIDAMFAMGWFWGALL